MFLATHGVLSRTSAFVPPVFANNYSIELDGIGDYVEVADADNLSFGNGTTDSPFSISAWIKPLDNARFRIAFKWGATSREYYFQTAGGGALQVKLNSSLSVYIGRNGQATISEDVWSHVVFTYDGSGNKNNINVYLNGVLDNGTTISSGTYTAMSNTTESFIIGGYNDGGNANGLIDETAIFTTELSASDVTSIYNNGVPNDISSLNPLSWWRCGDGDTAPTLTDNAGSNDGTMTNFSTFSTDVPQFNNKSIELDGISDYVDCGNDASLQITNTLSVSAWVKTTHTNYIGIYGKGNNVAQADNYLRMQNTGVIRAFLNNNTINVTGTTAINDGNWHHVMFVYVPSTSMTIYIDGSQDAQNTTSIPSAINNNYSNVYIGQFQRWLGNIDEVAVWNSDQSANVSTIYNSGVPNDISSLSPLSWWRCGDGDTAPTLTDNGSASNNGTMTNFSTFSTDVP